LALLAVTLLLGLITWSALGHSGGRDDTARPADDPSATLTSSPPTSSATAAPSSYAPFSMIRNPRGFTLAGELPDVDTKNALLAAMRTAFGPGVVLTDQLTVRPGIDSPDFAGLGSILGAAMSLPDFGFVLDGNRITLTGTAPSDAVKADVEDAATAALPNVTVDNKIRVVEPTPGGPTAPR
jgi:peptidoglycan-binding protein ArfA